MKLRLTTERTIEKSELPALAAMWRALGIQVDFATLLREGRAKVTICRPGEQVVTVWEILEDAP